ncbi:MAG: ORF6N domain-containing protein [Flavobacteriales bacterium]
MLDRDLAELYGVEVKQLKRQVKRNASHFPDDFMFELSKAELENWRSQFGTSNPSIKQGLRYAPYAFTENGVAQLSSVLNSERAIGVNIQIIRLFTRMREMLLTHKDLILELEKLLNSSKEHAGKIRVIFRYLKQMEKRETERVLLAQVAKEKVKVRPEAGYKRVGRKKEE